MAIVFAWFVYMVWDSNSCPLLMQKYINLLIQSNGLVRKFRQPAMGAPFCRMWQQLFVEVGWRVPAGWGGPSGVKIVHSIAIVLHRFAIMLVASRLAPRVVWLREMGRFASLYGPFGMALRAVLIHRMMAQVGRLEIL